MKSVIITGGTGFIGSNLAVKAGGLLEPGHRLFSLGSRDVDLINREETLRWFEKTHWMHEVSDIFHLAAVYKAGGWPATHPGTQFHCNMGINVNLLEAWRRFFPKARLTSVVSYCMYPDHEFPHPESEVWGTEPEPYLFSYAFTKKALLVGQRAYCQEFGLTASALVLPTVYGPRDDFSETSHVMGALIGKFVRAARQGLPEVEVWGDGLQEREFIHVNDVSDALLKVADMSSPPHFMNLGVGQTVTIKSLAEMMVRMTGFKGKVIFNTDRFVGARKRQLDNALLSKLLNWKPAVSLESGIASSIEWYESKLAEQR